MAAQPEPRVPLSRDRILQAALDLADESGIDSLTMRKLAQVLGFEAMSLYNHVANKDDLLDGILDLVLAESARSDDEPGPQLAHAPHDGCRIRAPARSNTVSYPRATQ